MIVHVHIKYNICMMIVELFEFTELTQIIVRFYFNIQSHIHDCTAAAVNC